MSLMGRHESAASWQSCRSGHQVADVCQVTGKRCAAVIDRDGCRTAAFGFNRRSTAKSERQHPVCTGRLAADRPSSSGRSRLASDASMPPKLASVRW